jgi:hypothetical protein
VFNNSIFFLFSDSSRFVNFTCIGEHVDPVFLFLLHLGVVFCVFSQSTLMFYDLSRGDRRRVGQTPIWDLTAMSCVGRSLFVTIDRLLFQLPLPDLFLPLPIAPTSDYVLLASISLCKFSVLQDTPSTAESFCRRVYADIFSFPAHPHSILRSIEDRLPADWQGLDDHGMKFLFSWALAQSHTPAAALIPVFAIWTLISRDQERFAAMLALPTLRALCEWLLLLWIGYATVIARLVAKPHPVDEEIDPFILLSVAMNRRLFGAQIARLARWKKFERLS